MGLKFLMILVGISLYKKINTNIIAPDIFVIFYKLTNLFDRGWIQIINSGL